ncbi:MAG TPA: NAD(P)/FAD-dependent oxidoreductase, partial [Actinomycetes bacterium]|nr:NAD(P)/FAD-dependent oxidoreductase [Actinomycetes bacterium]
MTTQEPFVIVGGGLAGAKAAETLRAEGFDGPVVLVAGEPEVPYERPPLSKDYLLGKADRESPRVHAPEWYAEHQVELRTGVQATRLDPATHRLALDTGEELAYAKLLLATGSSARRLPVPGADLEGVRYLRTFADSDRLLADLSGGGRRVVIVGAGWIGLEVAAAARSHGNEVTVVEPQPTPLHAVLGPEMGAVFARLHRAHGVDLFTDTTVREFRGASGRVETVATDAHAGLPADLVVVGIGAAPNVELAAAAGLEVEN